ncbi:MAG: cob(I)yrinic acid a,c-diamide adenosyltransferase [Pirellulales bacterium]|nr:cob(I)yrinic acid a,c-diamide adenosyltransferase [Pirellulales bacterium]
MKIYTRTGDSGQTSLGDGRRVGKDSAQMEFQGTLDELSALLGMARAEALPAALDAVVRRVQADLFVLGVEVLGARAGRPNELGLADRHVEQLEIDIDQFDAQLPRLTTFILSGGTPAAAVLHLARTVCRRAERRLVALIGPDPSAPVPVSLAYLNRLSDLLFVLARSANQAAGVAETTWESS